MFWCDLVMGVFLIDLLGYVLGNFDVEFDLYSVVGQKFDVVLSLVGLLGGNGQLLFSMNYFVDLKLMIVFYL